MPFWLQLVIPAAAGLVSALMGIALVPYLQKRRAFPPQAPKKEGDEAAEEERRPMLGGLLLLAGTVFAVALGFALLMQFGGNDRTSTAFQEQLDTFYGVGITTALWGIVGIISDVMIVRGRYNAGLWDYILLPLVLMAALAPMEFCFHADYSDNGFGLLAAARLRRLLCWEQGSRTGYRRRAHFRQCGGAARADDAAPAEIAGIAGSPDTGRCGRVPWLHGLVSASGKVQAGQNRELSAWRDCLPMLCAC